MNLLLLFILLNIINVIIQTVKSLLTIKGNKYIAAISNAIAYGFYTIVVVYMLCDLPLLNKALIVGLCNLVGVFIVKLIEEKSQKDKLWKIETTVQNTVCKEMSNLLKDAKISHNYIEGIGNDTIFNIFCHTKEESHAVREIIKQYNAKYFVSESKNL